MSYLNDEQNITSRMNFICFSSNTPPGEHKYMVRFKLMNTTGYVRYISSLTWLGARGFQDNLLDLVFGGVSTSL